MKPETLAQLVSQGVVTSIEIRSVNEEEIPINRKQPDGSTVKTTIKVRKIGAEIAATGQHIGLTQWSDRETNALPPFSAKRGEKVIACLRDFSTTRDGLSGTIEKIVLND